jgi:hypothetical protein
MTLKPKKIKRKLSLCQTMKLVVPPPRINPRDRWFDLPEPPAYDE